MPQSTPLYTVLGGAGAMGSITVRDLAETAAAGATLRIADFNLEKAQAMASAFQKLRKKGPRLEAVKVDINDPKGAQKALKGTTVLINTLPYAFNLQVMELALALKAHYTDLGGLFHMTRRQRELNARFEKSKLTAVLGMGAAPGITNLLARQAADQLDSVEAIHVRLAAVDKTRYKPQQVLPVSYSFKTILEEFSLQPAVFRKGKYRFLKPMSGREPYRFPAPVGLQQPMYTLHSEVLMAEGFQHQGVQEVSFKIAFDPQFVERVQFLRDLGLASAEPLQIQGVSMAPIDLVDRVVMNQPPAEAVGPARQYEILRSIVMGRKNGKKQTWLMDCHTAGMPDWEIGTDIDTGSPPAVVAQMLATGQISRHGALYPEEAVPVAPFFKALEKRQMFVKSQCKAGWKVPV